MPPALADLNPPGQLIEAVARGEVDIAIVWGPQAGYFAKHASAPLAMPPVSPKSEGPALRFVFDIAMGVRREDKALRKELDGFITRHKVEIRNLLRRYGVPVDQPALSKR